MHPLVFIGGLLSITGTVESRLRKLRLVTSSDYSSEVLDTPRQSGSSLECFRMCYTEYSRCFSITYNVNTGACTPRSWMDQSLSLSLRSGEELVYYAELCNTEMEFQVYAYGNVVQCFYISTYKADFLSARAVCRAKGSRLYTIKSSDKLQLLRHMVDNVTRSQTWIGLSDLVTEGHFVWEDIEPADVSFSVPWYTNQPDDRYGKEDCVEIGLRGSLSLNDNECSVASTFICEMDINF